MDVTVSNTEVSTSSQDAGKLLLRLTLAGFLLFHGISKLLGGVGFISGMLHSAGLPAGLAYLVYIGEVIAPLFLLIGVGTRVAALVIVVNMLVAILLVHSAQVFTLSPTGGWTLELQGFYLMTALTIAVLGAGRYSLGGENGKWN